MIKYTSIFFLIIISLSFIQCEEPIYTPKPRAYPKVEYPKKGYQAFNEKYCKMTFAYPTYAKIEQDNYFFEKEAPNDCWFNVTFPDFDGVLHCSYVTIDKGENNIETLQKDAFKMTDWHKKKASFIEDGFFENKHRTIGMTFDVEGPVASPVQFYLTDSLQQKHFIRGALYFNSRAEPDSLAPIIAFIKEDIQVLLESFEWTE